MARQKRALPEECDIKCRLADVSLKLFAERGYAATSVREIVKEAGVTAPVLYYYFGSKEGVYLTIMEQALNHLRSLLATVVEEALPAREKIVRLAREILLLHESYPDLTRVVYAVFYGPPQGAPHFDFTELHTGLLSAMERLVSDGVRAGDFEPGSESAASWAILGAVYMAIEAELNQPGRISPEYGIDRILEIIFRGIAKA